MFSATTFALEIEAKPRRFSSHPTSKAHCPNLAHLLDAASIDGPRSLSGVGSEN
jgi:hypothetical protein